MKYQKGLKKRLHDQRGIKVRSIPYKRTTYYLKEEEENKMIQFIKVQFSHEESYAF